MENLSYDSQKIINYMIKNNIINFFLNQPLKKELNLLLKISFPIYKNVKKNTKISLKESLGLKSQSKKRPNILYFLSFLYKEDKNVFDKILKESNNYCDNLERDLIYYIQNIDNNNYKNEQFFNWMNDYGLDIQIQINKLIEFGYFDNTNIKKNIKDIYGKFTPTDIQYDIENFMDHFYRYIGKYDNYVSTVDFNTENMSLKKKYTHLFISRSIFMMLISNSCNTSHVTCWMSNIKKKIPKYKLKKKYGISIGIKEVNTGATFLGNCKTIILWRKEELLKVLIHEMLHCLDLDFHNFPFSLKKKLKKYMNIDKNTDIKIFEAYVETWATILNIIISSIDINKENYKKIINDIYLFTNYEICFSCFQTAKILLFYGFDKFQDFFNSNSNFMKKDAKIKQNSSIISYFIIRSALLFSLKDFIIFCKKNNIVNRGKFSFLKFNNSNKCFEIFYDLIIKSLENKEYQNYINKIMIKMKKSENTFPYSSLRMTCVEFY